MCYDVTSGIRQLINYAKHRGDDPAYLDALLRKLQDWTEKMKPHFYVSGFAHPSLLVFTNEAPYDPQSMMWGLIPHWVKDNETARSIIGKTLNARSETIFEKPAFKHSAINKRCLIYIDAFYEHRHYKGKTYPYHIAMKDGSPLSLAGLWDEWADRESGELIRSVTIVTTTANQSMQKIHNNPKLNEARMPVILPKDKQNDWLAPIKSKLDKEALQKLLVPFPDERLEYYTVGRLKGKNAIGDTEQVEQKVIYPELID